MSTVLSPPALRPARFEDYPQIRVLSVENALSFPSFDDWRNIWLNNPVWDRLGPNAPIGWVLESDEGKVVGSFETVPMLYRFRGCDLIAAVSRPWCVEPGYRGFALHLLDEYFNQSVDLFVSTTVNINSINLFGEFASRVPVGSWDQMSCRITRYDSFAIRALRKLGAPVPALLAYPLAAGLWLRDACTKSLAVSPQPVAIDSTDAFDSRFDQFWSELVYRNPEKLLAERSSRALSWHFDTALRAGRLWILTASSNQRLSGYCIFRQEYSTPGVRRMRLIDYQSLHEETDLLPEFLRAAIRQCAAEDFYVLEHVGVGVPAMKSFDDYASYRQNIESWKFFYHVADSSLESVLRDPGHWDPSLFEGDATLCAL